MKPARRPSLSDHPAPWYAAARDAGRVAPPCPKCGGYVQVLYDPDSTHARRPTGAHHRATPERSDGPLEMSAPTLDNEWKGVGDVTHHAIPLPVRDEDPVPRRRVFTRCWNCGASELLQDRKSVV